MALIIAALAFATVVLLVFGLYLLLTARERQLEQRVFKYAVDPWTPPAEPAAQAPLRQRVRSLTDRFWRLRFLDPLIVRLERFLLAARVLLKPEEFLLIDVVAAAFGGLLLFLLLGNPIGAVLGALLGAAAPWVAVVYARTQRQRRLEQQVADLLTVLTNSLRAGHSLLQALQSAAEELPQPLAVELHQTLNETRLGAPVDEAMEWLCERTGVEVLDLVVTAVLIQRKVGGNLAEILDRISHTIRERIRIRGTLRTVTAQARMSAVVISVLPVGFFIILSAINPSMFGVLVGTLVGNLLLILAVLMEVAGILVVRKIVDIRI